MSSSSKVLPGKSGLNQWNGLGRKRSPGESYIPVPRSVHTRAPNFFPKLNYSFELTLPNHQTVFAKICQSGGKALMSNPNSSLNFWLFQLIDGSIDSYVNRFSSKRPYVYEDLVKLGFDCVRIERGGDGNFAMMTESLGGYEDWLG
jgi:hypothetical protein